MKLDGQMFPFLDTTRGANLPPMLHPGISKEEFLFISVVQGAIANGKDPLTAVSLARDTVEIYSEPVKKDELLNDAQKYALGKRK